MMTAARRFIVHYECRFCWCEGSDFDKRRKGAPRSHTWPCWNCGRPAIVTARVLEGSTQLH